MNISAEAAMVLAPVLAFGAFAGGQVYELFVSWRWRRWAARQRR